MAPLLQATLWYFGGVKASVNYSVTDPTYSYSSRRRLLCPNKRYDGWTYGVFGDSISTDFCRQWFSITSSSFTPENDYASGILPSGVAIGDLDGDGRPDFVVANYSSNTISVFRNTTAGDSISTNSFGARVDIATGIHPWGVVIGDLDGDGKLDIIVSDGISDSISVFQNTSVSGSNTISFASKVSFPGGSGYGVALADLDGDGKPDIVATNRNGNSVSVLRNISNGAIAFAASIDFPAGELPYGVAVGDVDGDGKPDLVVANNDVDTLSIFLNTSTSGNISFAAKVNIPTSGTPISVAVADMNGDGKPDIISANNGDSTISVFQNNSNIGTVNFPTRTDFALGGARTPLQQVILMGTGNSTSLSQMARAQSRYSEIQAPRGSFLLHQELILLTVTFLTDLPSMILTETADLTWS